MTAIVESHAAFLDETSSTAPPPSPNGLLVNRYGGSSARPIWPGDDMGVAMPSGSELRARRLFALSHLQQLAQLSLQASTTSEVPPCLAPEEHHTPASSQASLVRIRIRARAPAPDLVASTPGLERRRPAAVLLALAAECLVHGPALAVLRGTSGIVYLLDTIKLHNMQYEQELAVHEEDELALFAPS
ncbi:hypothetical protein VPH35_001039 [Triticum aestivum]